MNRKLCKLIFSTAWACGFPRRKWRAAVAKGKRRRVADGLLLAGFTGTSAQAELPVPCAAVAAGIPVTAGQANYHIHDRRLLLTGWATRRFSIGKVLTSAPATRCSSSRSSLATQNLCRARTSPRSIRSGTTVSVIAGILSQAVVRPRISSRSAPTVAFMGSSQVNLNSFTASSLISTTASSSILLMTTQRRPAIRYGWFHQGVRGRAHHGGQPGPGDADRADGDQ